MDPLVELLPKKHWEIARVGRRVQWAPGLFTLCLERQDVDFVAGQFLMLGLPIDGKFIKRAYSVASAPRAPLEFYIVRVDDGALTPLLDKLDVGDRVGVQVRPAGHFTLELVPDARDLWLVATGTGLAPYISMLREESPWQRFENIIVVHGARNRADLSYEDELRLLGERHGGRLRWLGGVTRDPAAKDVFHARITNALEDGSLEEVAGLKLSPEHSQVLLCGNPAMVQQIEAMLGERGMRKNRKREPGHITVERYW